MRVVPLKGCPLFLLLLLFGGVLIQLAGVGFFDFILFFEVVVVFISCVVRMIFSFREEVGIYLCVYRGVDSGIKCCTNLLRGH